MKLQFTANCLWNAFQVRSLMPSENLRSITLSFPKDTKQVKVILDVSAITDNELEKYFDELMIKTLSFKTTGVTTAGNNAFKFHAEGFSFVQHWINVMPEGIIKSIAITLHGTAGVEVLVHMQDQVNLNDIRQYLQRVEDGHAMWESVQRPPHYTGDCTSFLSVIHQPEILN